MVPDDDDKTRMGAALPPPKLPSGPAKKQVDVQATGAPPVAVPPVAVPPAAVPSSPQAASAVAGSGEATVHPAATPEDATVLITDRGRAMVRLQRVQPAGRSEMIVLDRSTYMLGRSHTCDIELYTPTASREHARLVCRDDQWYVQPFEEHIVLVNGKAVRHEARVADRMRLQLGADELVFLDGGGPVAGDAAAGRRRWLWVAAGAVVVGLAAAAWFLFVRGG